MNQSQMPSNNNSGVLRIMPPAPHGYPAAAGANNLSLSAAAAAAAAAHGPKGLRYYSYRVMVKVRELGVTTYQDVADMLVREYYHEQNVFQEPHLVRDPKLVDEARNIRRRVYDALNVQIAMNIVRKDRKNIEFVGLPVSADEQRRTLLHKRADYLDRINKKREQLKELLVQLVAYKSLVERNKAEERSKGPAGADSTAQLPYIVITTDANTEIKSEASEDETEYLFTFDQPFEIHDDIEVLKRLGLARGLDKLEGAGQLVDPDDVAAIKRFVPAQLHHYVDKLVADGDLREAADLAEMEGETSLSSASVSQPPAAGPAPCPAPGAVATPAHTHGGGAVYRPVVVRRGGAPGAGPHCPSARPLAPAEPGKSARTSPYTVPPRSNIKLMPRPAGVGHQAPVPHPAKCIMPCKVSKVT